MLKYWINKRYRDEKKKESDNTMEKFTLGKLDAALNMNTSSEWVFKTGYDDRGLSKKIITTEEVNRWSKHDPTSKTNNLLPTWVICSDIFKFGQWWRVPDYRNSLYKLGFASNIGFRPDGSKPMNMATGTLLHVCISSIGYFYINIDDKKMMLHALIAALFGAPLNSKLESPTDEVEVDHIIEGVEGKMEEKFWLLTNLQFLTGKDNKVKFARWIGARKDPLK